MLYENGSYVTALVLAAFAREELGCWDILLKLRKRVLDEGASFTVEGVKTACDDHVSKQRASMLSLMTRADKTSGLGKLLETRAAAAPGTKERQDADKQVKKIDQLKLKRTPDDRHRLRMNGLYVDILSEEQWNRPAKRVSQTDAYEFLNDAINDYRMERSQRYLELHTLKANDPELHDALMQWPDRPEPQHVDFPSMPAAA